MGGNAYIALTEETRAPPRNVRSISAFSEELLAGDYGLVVERIVGERYRQPRTVEWDLSRFEGKDMRLYLVDVETDHYGQIALSEVRITEEAPR
jgi:hypothetical protein